VCKHHIPFLLVFVRVSKEVDLVWFKYRHRVARGGKYDEVSSGGCVIAKEILSENRLCIAHIHSASLTIVGKPQAIEATLK
jgi:hypothetical protein